MANSAKRSLDTVCVSALRKGKLQLLLFLLGPQRFITRDQE